MLAIVLLGLAASCVSEEPPPSIWPPEGFAFVAEEIVQDGERVETRRKFRLHEDGLVVYATSSRPLAATLDAASVGAAADGTAAEPLVLLPVYDRLSVYQLVPSAVRGFARRLHKLGFLMLDDVIGNAGQGRPSGPTSMVVMTWSSVHGVKRVALRGSSRGTPAELLRAVDSLLPAGEQFPGIEAGDRAPVSVLRGVPPPRTDALGALAAHELLLEGREADADLLLDTFALACRAASRRVAEGLLERWLQAGSRAGGDARTGFEDRARPDLQPYLRQMLPRD